MTTITQPLRDEHKELLPQAEILKEAADQVSEVLSERAWQDARQAYEFLAYHLIPHAYAEEKALYPVVQKVIGASLSTATMSRDHAEVGRLAEELKTRLPLRPGRLSDSQVLGLRRVLYGLYTLVQLHFAKEEEIYLPLLDARLTHGEASEMFEAMEKAAGEAKARAV
jgi:iron-sulfur cluster repair protein YtfE (RIC family)